MKPVEFDGMNVVIAKDQAEYLPLPAQVLEGGEVITCWELTDDELAEVQKTKRVWLGVWTFGHPLQPVLLTTVREAAGLEVLPERSEA
jgi:hypothetical protein